MYNLFSLHPSTFVNNWKSETIFKVSLDSSVYWDPCMTGCTEEYENTFSTAVFMSRTGDFFIFSV